MAKAVGKTPDYIKNFYKDNNEKMAFLKHTLLEKKAIKLIIENSVIENIEPVKEEEKGV